MNLKILLTTQTRIAGGTSSTANLRDVLWQIPDQSTLGKIDVLNGFTDRPPRGKIPILLQYYRISQLIIASLPSPQVPAVQEHLDALDSLCANLKLDKSQFAKGWCALLKRTQQFKTIVILFKITLNEPLQKELSRLAFAQNHPEIPRNFLISHDKRIEVIDTESSQEAETLLATVQDAQLATSLDGAALAQWRRFLEFHPSLVNAEEAFLYFYRIAQDPEIAHEKRVKALNCQLSQKTQKLLKKSIMSTSFQSQIIAEGFDHAYLNSQNLVELTINTVAKFEAEWRPTKT
ncbi:uncharacterized protein PGTG_07672 [Puccinia graminis f. sp. tritici CRL 75-36-700-3]|uniref:Uncharacterized protein n=1 Tax=Puccinia graminis f. sp. tritici (strain CRL 75-36-700-3 / race SCCL) TaxID=418459 RepID=E3KD24_PUCGT|nr:uncharacterized protein PGTG_07672 [Puccinia graminis f. sp. tritici CRL 75-36-700-3]EFP82275.1 hypothetical protein PGTG_07672 [Puccinia graminis f. sp. tritici CRL 75-36-700-3]